MMIYLLFFPFLLQTIVIFFDEFYFHWKRGLPRWERIGHPLDTLSTLLCFMFVLYYPCDALHGKIYAALALFSCLFVTKDEFVHKDCCPASEQWLHALLFINHPIVLFLLWVLWSVYKADPLPSYLLSFEGHRPLVGSFLWMQTFMVGLFALYQALYWNLIRREKA
jgi:hypothetical protein